MLGISRAIFWGWVRENHGVPAHWKRRTANWISCQPSLVWGLCSVSQFKLFFQFLGKEESVNYLPHYWGIQKTICKVGLSRVGCIKALKVKLNCWSLHPKNSARCCVVEGSVYARAGSSCCSHPFTSFTPWLTPNREQLGNSLSHQIPTSEQRMMLEWILLFSVSPSLSFACGKRCQPL